MYTRTLRLIFKERHKDRSHFLRITRTAIMEFTGEHMRLDALLIEMLKNIWDHADGRGVAVITQKDDSYEFEVWDEGTRQHDFEHCASHSTLVGNGINCGAGLGMIQDVAEALGIVLRVDTSRGFRYFGTYKPRIPSQG